MAETTAIATTAPADRAVARRLGWSVGAAVLVGLVVAPQFGLPPYIMSLVIEVMIFAIFAMSLDLLLGYTGLVSLGHAAFFATGSYAAGLAAKFLTHELVVTTVIGLVVSMVLAVAIGWLSIRLSGFYFLMITFAFGQMIYSVAYRWNWLTGGSDGLNIPAATFFGAHVLGSRIQIYYTVLVGFVICFMLMRRIVGSPFGEVLAGIRENPRRMRAIGFDVRGYRLAVFVIGAGFAAFAGILNAQFNFFVAPDSAHWTESASVLVMVLVGGAGTLVGPVIGAGVVIMLQNWLSSYTQYWSLFLGLLFIVLITIARDGILGLAGRGWRRLRRGVA